MQISTVELMKFSLLGVAESELDGAFMLVEFSLQFDSFISLPLAHSFVLFVFDENVF